MGNKRNPQEDSWMALVATGLALAIVIALCILWLYYWTKS